MELCKKKNFFWFIILNSQFRLNFEYFQKNMNLIGYVLTKLQAPKDVVKQMSKKTCFRRPYEKWNVKWSETRLKSARQHLYQIWSIDWSIWKKLSCKKSISVICKTRRQVLTS